MVAAQRLGLRHVEYGDRDYEEDEFEVAEEEEQSRKTTTSKGGRRGIRHNFDSAPKGKKKRLVLLPSSPLAADDPEPRSCVQHRKRRKPMPVYPAAEEDFTPVSRRMAKRRKQQAT